MGCGQSGITRVPSEEKDLQRKDNAKKDLSAARGSKPGQKLKLEDEDENSSLLPRKMSSTSMINRKTSASMLTKQASELFIDRKASGTRLKRQSSTLLPKRTLSLTRRESDLVIDGADPVTVDAGANPLPSKTNSEYVLGKTRSVYTTMSFSTLNVVDELMAVKTIISEKDLSNKPILGREPAYKYGPNAYTDMSEVEALHADPASQFLEWTERPETILLICDAMDSEIAAAYRKLCTWLIKRKNMTVYSELKIYTSATMEDKFPGDVNEKIITFSQISEKITQNIHLVVTLGSSSTVTYAATMFQTTVPPIIAFNMTLVDFLAPFTFKDYKKCITKAIVGNVPLCLRSRLKCSLCTSDSLVCEPVKKVEKVKKVLNEVVIDRGSSAYLCNLELYIENELVTVVQGDGLIISTPSGSTLYSSAAGSSLVHPSIPSILITPICAHSLSFRPVLIPAGIEVKIVLSAKSRTGSAWLSLDGFERMKMEPSDMVRITTSVYPVPCIASKGQVRDWYHSLDTCLHWNVNKDLTCPMEFSADEDEDSVSVAEKPRANLMLVAEGNEEDSL